MLNSITNVHWKIQTMENYVGQTTWLISQKTPQGEKNMVNLCRKDIKRDLRYTLIVEHMKS